MAHRGRGSVPADAKLPKVRKRIRLGWQQMIGSWAIHRGRAIEALAVRSAGWVEAIEWAVDSWCLF